MEHFLLSWMLENKPFAFVISILLNVIISISGVLPSAFITAANIAVFDFNKGLLVSIIGEAAGAIISFILYRKGLSKLPKLRLKHKLLEGLQQSKGFKAVLLVLILRIIPFVPSGVVTLTAAYSKMGLFSFSIASTIGKLPSLFIEAYSVNRVLQFSTEWQIGLFLLILVGFVIYFVLKKKKQNTFQ